MEVLQSISEAPLKVCPVCMGPLRKLIYAAGIIYKGSGYYSTDYKVSSESKEAGNKSSSSGDSTSSSGSEPAAKTESKPAAKEAAKPSGESKSGSE